MSSKTQNQLLLGVIWIPIIAAALVTPNPYISTLFVVLLLRYFTKADWLLLFLMTLFIFVKLG